METAQGRNSDRFCRYLIDSLTVTQSAPRAPHNVQDTLVNPNASPATKSLHSYLLSNYGTKILSGQQELSSITWIEQNVGKTPAIAGLDLMDYSPSRVERGTVGTSINEAITFDQRNGIITFCWHWVRIHCPRKHGPPLRLLAGSLRANPLLECS